MGRRRGAREDEHGGPLRLGEPRVRVDGARAPDGRGEGARAGVAGARPERGAVEVDELQLRRVGVREEGLEGLVVGVARVRDDLERGEACRGEQTSDGGVREQGLVQVRGGERAQQLFRGGFGWCGWGWFEKD